MNRRKEKTLAEWLNENEKQVRKSLLVYEITKPRVKPEFLAEFAKKFKLEGELKSEKDVFYLSQEKQATVLYNFSIKNKKALKYSLPNESELNIFS